jgi:hypothetical protein
MAYHSLVIRGSSFKEGVGASSVTQLDVSAYEIHSQESECLFPIFLSKYVFLTV